MKQEIIGYGNLAGLVAVLCFLWTVQIQIGGQIGDLDIKIGDLDTKIAMQISDLKTETGDLELRLTKQIGDLELDLGKQISDLELRLVDRARDLETRLFGRITKLEATVASIDRRLPPIQSWRPFFNPGPAFQAPAPGEFVIPAPMADQPPPPILP